MLYITSDHAGFDLKNHIIEYLQTKGVPFQDLGPFTYVESDDYPDHVKKLTGKMAEDPENNLGIAICRNGVGVSVAANKAAGIRAVLSWDPLHAASSKSDDNSNVLALPADYIGKTKALEIVDSWLKTPFDSEERHKRRLDKVREMEKI